MNHDRLRPRRLLIVGSGDVALRALPWLRARFRVIALCRSEEQAARWRSAGATPLIGDLDQPASLRRLRGLADLVLHCAPPPASATGDPRTDRLLAALDAARIIPRRLVYISTTGVYGNCAGARASEVRPLNPETARARRRVAAEQSLRAWVRRHSGSRCPGLVILRAPGIYAADRLPLTRLRAGTPALLPDEDGYTSHIHADDLALAAGISLFRLRAGRVVNVCDDSKLRMGDWFDAVAAAFGLAFPPRVSRARAEAELPESLLGFMRESRRLDNRRLKEESRVRLRYPTVAEGLAAARQHQGVLEVGAHRHRGGGEQQRQGGQVGQQAGPQEQQAGQHGAAIVQHGVEAGHAGTPGPLAAHAVTRAAQQQQAGECASQRPQTHPGPVMPGQGHQQHQVAQGQEE